MVDLVAPASPWRSRSSSTVDRPRLRAVLDGGAPLVLLRGPRGAGKSTLIDQWVATLRPAPLVVRMTVDREHSDDAGFWSDLAHALDRATGGTGSDDAASHRSARRRVRRALRAVDGPVLLVVEHAERITEDAVHRDLVELVDSVPQVRAVVGTETTVLLEQVAVADLGAVVVDFAALRFTLEETVAVLERHGVERASERARELVDLLHGWPGPTVGLLRHRQRMVGGWDTPLEPRVYLGLIDEFLDRLGPAGFRDFLLRTSVVDELTPELARVLDGTERADEHFARLAASSFVRVTGVPEPTDLVGRAGAAIPGAPPRVVVALAETARRALTNHLELTDPELVRELRTVAAQWYREAGDPVRAARYAYAAPAPLLLARVVDESAARLLTHHPEEMRTWLDGLPEGALDELPVAATVRTVLAEPQPLDRTARPGADEDLHTLVERGLPLLIELHTGGRYVAASELASVQTALAARVPDRWRALAPDVRTVIALQWGLSHLLVGDLRTAQRDLREAYRTGRDSGTAYLARNAAVNVALIRVLLHDLREAEEWLARAEALPRAEGFVRDIVEEWDPLVRALVASHRTDHDGAVRALSTYQGRGPDQPGWIFEAFARAHLGVLGPDPAEAMARLHHDRTDRSEALRETPLASWLLTSVGVDLALRLGRPVAAQALLDRTERTPGLSAARARLALAVGEPDEALGHVAGGLSTFGGYVFRRPDLLLARACALGQDGPGAEDAWANAFTAVRSSGAVRSLALVPRRVLATLGPLATGAEGLLDQIRTLPDAMPEVADLVSLSERERLVLRELARTASHQEIARRLFVSVNTVKTQVRSIYRKLGTSSRPATLAAAQAQGFDLGPIED